MSTVVVLSLTSSGHINPSLPLVAELIARGEHVIYFGIEQYRAIIEGSGAEYRSYSHPDYLKPKVHGGEFFGVMAHFAKASKVNLPALIDELREIAPDYLLLDSMCIWGNIAQQVLDIPAVTFSSVFMMAEKMSCESLMDMAYLPRPKEVVYSGLKSLYEYFEIAQDLDKTYNCKSPGLVEAFTNPQPLNIVFTSYFFHPKNTLFSTERYKFVGPSLAKRTEKHEFPLEKIDRKSTIFISLGTINNDHTDFYKQCFEAFA